MKKFVVIDERADQEIQTFSQEVQRQFAALFIILGKEGFLREPYAKRINHDLFELRVRFQGQWRAIYTYFDTSSILVLSAFSKKAKKTPKNELKRALNRLREHRKE